MRNAALALLFVITAGCAERDRPGPVSSLLPFNLFSEIVSPRTSEAFFAGRSMTVRVRGHESSGTLTGLGLVARRFDTGATLDSTVIAFPLREDTVHNFSLRIPSTIPSNAQIDLYAIAFAREAAPRLSPPRAIIVVSCFGNPACQ